LEPELPGFELPGFELPELPGFSGLPVAGVVEFPPTEPELEFPPAFAFEFGLLEELEFPPAFELLLALPLELELVVGLPFAFGLAAMAAPEKNIEIAKAAAVRPSDFFIYAP
jgi:hypothetical protein